MLNKLLMKTVGVVAVAGGTLLAANSANAQFVRYGVRTPFYRATLGQNLYTGTVYGRAAAYNPFNGTYYRQRVAYNPFTGATYNSVGAYNRFFGGTYGSTYGYSYPSYYSALANYGYGGYGYSALAGYGYGGYGSGYGYPSYYGSDQSGYASAVDAEGRYLINEQQSRVVREQVRQAKVDTQRRVFDEYLYERAKAPTWEDDRERLLGEQFRRSQNDPPLNEVRSGKALNVLLTHLQRPHVESDAGALTLDPDVVKRLNFTGNRGSANIGLLKDARLSWPVVLTDADYREPRERLTVLAREAVEQAAARGRVDGTILDTMGRDLDQLQEQLRGKVSKTNPRAYIEAKQFLSNFEDAVNALAQPDAGSYFSGKFTFQGKTVADLVRFMSQNGLQFAPAVPGDDAAYTAVHQALAAYAMAINPALHAVVRQ